MARRPRHRPQKRKTDIVYLVFILSLFQDLVLLYADFMTEDTGKNEKLQWKPEAVKLGIPFKLFDPKRTNVNPPSSEVVLEISENYR